MTKSGNPRPRDVGAGSRSFSYHIHERNRCLLRQCPRYSLTRQITSLLGIYTSSLRHSTFAMPIRLILMPSMLAPLAISFSFPILTVCSSIMLSSFVRLRCKDKHNIPIFKEIRCISYNGHEKTATDGRPIIYNNVEKIKSGTPGAEECRRGFPLIVSCTFSAKEKCISENLCTFADGFRIRAVSILTLWVKKWRSLFIRHSRM